MVRLILNWKGVDLVTRELVDDFCHDWPCSIEPDTD